MKNKTTPDTTFRRKKKKCCIGRGINVQIERCVTLWVLTQQQSNRQEEETHRVDQGCHAAPASRPPFPRKFSGARRKSQAGVVEEVVVVRKDQAAHTVLLRGARHSVSLLSARQLRTPL